MADIETKIVENISNNVLTEIRILSGDKPIYRADDIEDYISTSDSIRIFFKDGKDIEYSNVSYALVRRKPKENK